MDSNQRKLTLADLQSAPFSHSGIYPFRLSRGGCMGNPAGPDKENLALARKNFPEWPDLKKAPQSSADRRCEPTRPAIDKVMRNLAHGMRREIPKNTRRTGVSHSWSDWNHGVSQRVAS